MVNPPNVGPVRPPSEAHSLLIRVMKNCPWNRCEFCSTFKGEKFEVIPVAEVKSDILAFRAQVDLIQRWAEQVGEKVSEVARFHGIVWMEEDCVKSAFLQDSDSLVTRTEDLAEIVTFLRRALPTLEKVCSYSRAKTLVRKKPEELQQLREAGLTRVHVGLETGDDELLAYVQKGATSEEMVLAGRKAMEAGFELSMYVMPGLGGREMSEQHIRNTARVLNEVNPHFIRLRTLQLADGTPLYEKAKRGEFHVDTVEEAVLEVKRLVESLKVTSRFVTSDYAPNFYVGEMDEKLPEGKDKVLQAIDRALAWWREKGEPKRNPFAGMLNRLE